MTIKLSNSRCGGGYKLFSCIFIILIFLPIIFKSCNIDFAYGLVNERRNLAKLPAFKDQTLKVFLRNYDTYLKDNIPFRQLFLTGYMYLTENLLNSYEKENVSGKNGEYYPNFNIAPCIEESLGIIPYSKQAIEWLRLSEAGKYAFFYSKNIPYLLFTVPDKTTLYPEMLPFYANWIPHQGWYKNVTDALNHSNIPFYDLQDILEQDKSKYRLYDKAFDIVHWNGNALITAYAFIDKVLQKNSPVFKQINVEHDYTSYKKEVSAGVYGKEKTIFIKIQNKDFITCGELPVNLQNRTQAYEKMCINKKAKGVLWFFSDSYFAATHGSSDTLPLVHAAKTYIHSHYNLNSPYTFTDVANERFGAGLMPDAVIEEFVERMGGPMHAVNDYLLRILGDLWLHTGGYLLDHSFNKNDIILTNAKFSNYECIQTRDADKNQETNLKINALNGDPMISFKQSVTADYLGRAVVMAKYIAPSDTVAQLFYTTDPSPYFYEDKSVRQPIHTGENLVHLTVHVKPFEKVYLRFDPGAVPGQYIFENIPEVEDLRKRMKEDGL